MGDFRVSRHAAAIVVSASLIVAAAPVHAQLALPGAVAPTPAGTIVSAPKAKKRAATGMGEARGTAVMPKAPSEDTIIGKGLTRDGTGSVMTLARAGADLQVTKLIFSGDRLSRSGEECKVEISGMPLKVTPRESGSGLRRYQIDLPACDFTFDVLDGAVLVTNKGKACEIKQADCRADPEGLWGTGASEFDPKKASEMMGARARVEKTVRGNFRVLFDRNSKEKELRAYLVREQAGFSSWREEICRSYAQESDYGYCALRLTEARAIALGAQLAKGVKLPEDVAAVIEAPAKDETAKDSAAKDAKK